MNKKYKITVTLDDVFVDKHQEEEIPVAKDTSPTNVQLIQYLLNHFSPAEMNFITPERVIKNKESFQLVDGKFREADGDFDTNLWLIWGTNSKAPHFGLRYVQEQYTAYSKVSGNTKRFSNPLHTKASLDKKMLYKFDNEGLLPERYNIRDWQELKAIVGDTGKIVLKHRVGAEGDNIYLVDRENVDKLRETVTLPLSDFIAQEYIDTQAEKRLMIFGNQVVGARIMYERNHPWDDTSTNKPGLIKSVYKPTNKEVNQALRLHHEIGLDYSAIDFLTAKDRQVLLEVNGICPGLESPTFPFTGSIYYVADRFAEFVKGLSEK